MADRDADRGADRDADRDAGPQERPRVILASASPRRLQLLNQIGLDPVVAPTDIDETPLGREPPVAYVRRLAIAKAEAADAHPDAHAGDIVIAADTTVDVDGAILSKPESEGDARRMLSLLSGRTHRVHTGLAIRYGRRTAADVNTTMVTMIAITDELMDWYVGTGEPMGKAGGYAIQGEAAMLVERVQGSTSNVVGLPLALLDQLLARLGVSVADLCSRPDG